MALQCGLILFLFLWTICLVGSFLGCTQYEYGKFGSRWRVKEWQYVRGWMRSCDRYDWNDKFMGLNEAQEGGSEVFELCFTPAWGGLFMTYNVTNCYCRNLSSECLKVSSFPSFANAVELEGAFDLSNAEIDESIEYFRWSSGCGNGFKYTTANLDVFFPSFPAATRLRCLEMEFSPITGCYDYVPVLNLVRYSKLENLRKVRFLAYFPMTNIESLLANTQLESAELEMLYESADWRSCAIGDDYLVADDKSECKVFRGVFGDKSFRELLALDFGDYDEIDIKIDLAEIRHFDMQRLLCGGSTCRHIMIKSHNCIIDNLPCIIDYKNELVVILTMEFDSNGLEGARGSLRERSLPR